VSKKYFVSDITIKAINEFDLNIFKATDILFSRWEQEQYYMTIAQAQVYVLFFRNSHIWDSWRTLISQGRFHGSEFLFRSLFEGVLIFEWCLKDIDIRSSRFRMTAWGSTAEYFELKEDNNLGGIVKKYRDGAKWAKEQGLPNMPNIRQIVEELYGDDAKNRYVFFKYLSKVMHGMFERWKEYENRPGALNLEDCDMITLWNVMNAKAAGSYLQMRNIEFMGNLFEPMRYEGYDDLENKWALIYKNIWEDENR
jgi:hypothetical protein